MNTVSSSSSRDVLPSKAPSLAKKPNLVKRITTRFRRRFSQRDGRKASLHADSSTTSLPHPYTTPALAVDSASSPSVLSPKRDVSADDAYDEPHRRGASDTTSTSSTIVAELEPPKLGFLALSALKAGVTSVDASGLDGSATFSMVEAKDADNVMDPKDAMDVVDYKAVAEVMDLENTGDTVDSGAAADVIHSEDAGVMVVLESTGGVVDPNAAVDVMISKDAGEETVTGDAVDPKDAGEETVTGDAVDPKDAGEETVTGDAVDPKAGSVAEVLASSEPRIEVTPAVEADVLTEAEKIPLPPSPASFHTEAEVAEQHIPDIPVIGEDETLLPAPSPAVDAQPAFVEKSISTSVVPPVSRPSSPQVQEKLFPRPQKRAQPAPEPSPSHPDDEESASTSLVVAGLAALFMCIPLPNIRSGFRALPISFAVIWYLCQR